MVFLTLLGGMLIAAFLTFFIAISSADVGSKLVGSARFYRPDCLSIFGADSNPYFSFEELEPQVFLLSFPDQVEMGRTLMRFQEYYESREFRGKAFSRKEFKAWYRSIQKD